MRVRLMLSQNGYKSRDSSLIATYTVVRDVKLSLRKGDASVVQLHFARWFDKNIEPLHKEQCGGYNPRAIAGSGIDSNHASGTAEDLNWKKHVRGKHNTFSAEDQKKIRAQLKFYEGVLRWGGDYKKATIDDMHFEINAGPTQLARIAKKCKDADKPKPAYKPKAVKVDGVLGPETIKLWQYITKQKISSKLDDSFVKWLQGFLKARVDHRLVVDGDLGKKTIAALQRYLKSPVDGLISEPKSQLIVALQRRLNQARF